MEAAVRPLWAQAAKSKGGTVGIKASQSTLLGAKSAPATKTSATSDLQSLPSSLHHDFNPAAVRVTSGTSSMLSLGMIASLHKVIAGGAAGIANTITGHPLDTIKVRIQNANGNNNLALSGVSNATKSLTIRECAQMTLQKEGLLGFYKGVGPPITVGAALGAAFFVVAGTAREFVCNPGQTSDQLSLSQTVVAAELTAPIYSFFACPIDVVKCRLQADVRRKGRYKGMVDCFVRIVERENPMALWSGYWGTWGRRVIGLPFYFGSYDLMRDLLKPVGGSRADVHPLGNALAGCVAGTFLWSAAYPCDLIKTQMHMNPGRKSDGKGKGTGKAQNKAPAVTHLSIAKSIYRESGIRGLYRGFAPAVLRAGPANGVFFMVYEQVMQCLRDR